MSVQRVSDIFQQIFQGGPEVFIKSPGRVNLIGEHTDYNDGFVMPMALEQGTYLALQSRQDPTVDLYSEETKSRMEIDLASLAHGLSHFQGWEKYAAAVLNALQTVYGPLKGFSAAICSDLPIGAGLSSSASFELALAYAVSWVNNIPWQPVAMAKLMQVAESEGVGVSCGIMDQLICAVGQQGHALKIDCRSLETASACLPPASAVVILDTGTRRGLKDSAYNQRRQECLEAAHSLQVASLREARLDELFAYKSKLPPLLYRRAYHVVSENERVLSAFRALKENDAQTLGRLLIDSHHSLNRFYEVSSEALNLMVSLALQSPGCYGARMTGAGFGGCVVALVAVPALKDFLAIIEQNYNEQSGYTLNAYVSSPAAGVSLIRG